LSLEHVISAQKKRGKGFWVQLGNPFFIFYVRDRKRGEKKASRAGAD